MLKNFLNVNPVTKNLINARVADNCSKPKPFLLFLPLAFLFFIATFIFFKGCFSIAGYIQIQKEYFFFINSKLSQFPSLIDNLTEFGNAFIFLSLLTSLMFYAPTIWESLITANLISCLLSLVLKKLFSIPRPALTFDKNSFTIIGKAIQGHNSLPSGHSITIFTILTVLLFSFMPRKIKYKILWVCFILILGLTLASTRVGVGAHYPLDVVVGSILGYISGMLGLLVTQKYRNWFRLHEVKYCPILMVLFVICAVVVMNKIFQEHLIVLYFSLASLLVSLLKTIYVYVKR